MWAALFLLREINSPMDSGASVSQKPTSSFICGWSVNRNGGFQSFAGISINVAPCTQVPSTLQGILFTILRSFTMKTLTSSSLLFTLLSLVNAQLDGIDQQDIIDEAEHLLVDNTGMNSVPFVSVVSPCSNYAGFASDLADRGEQTSAQWVRFAP